jgi:hypothetical protein
MVKRVQDMLRAASCDVATVQSLCVGGWGSEPAWGNDGADDGVTQPHIT